MLSTCFPISLLKVSLYGEKLTPPYTKRLKFEKTELILSFLVSCNSFSKYIITHGGIPPIAAISSLMVSLEISVIFFSQSSIQFVFQEGMVFFLKKAGV